jgi:hypothetical protein
LAKYEFDYTEINQGFAIIEADTVEEAEKLAIELYYEGGVVWHGVDISVEQIEESN